MPYGGGANVANFATAAILCVIRRRKSDRIQDHFPVLILIMQIC
jgi:hypothetical protein